jgi:hypothetical protein
LAKSCWNGTRRSPRKRRREQRRPWTCHRGTRFTRHDHNSQITTATRTSAPPPPTSQWKTTGGRDRVGRVPPPGLVALERPDAARISHAAAHWAQAHCYILYRPQPAASSQRPASTDTATRRVAYPVVLSSLTGHHHAILSSSPSQEKERDPGRKKVTKLTMSSDHDE